MDNQVECEICVNCKKEIPHNNYVMHTAHCARNITLCKTCKEPIPKNQFEDHSKKCQQRKVAEKPKPPPLNIEKNEYYKQRKENEDRKRSQWREEQMRRQEKFIDAGHSLKDTKKDVASVANESKSLSFSNGKTESASGFSSVKPKPKPVSSLIPCKYCELELPLSDLGEHEDYCGARTDKCQDCGELVMFKYKQLHEETNHGFLKLNDEPGPRPTWESTAPLTNSDTSFRPRRRSPLRNFSTDFDLPYIPPSPAQTEKRETYREISRRLDCKTEYIRNLLHDSASITVPLRSNGAVPRNHFNHNKGPAPQPPRRRNPPTELEIPCEFCGVPVPHEDLIQHETGCRPDLARFNPRRARSPSPDDYFVAPAPSSPEVELPCEFCADMIPASQLLRHQATCL